MIKLHINEAVFEVSEQQFAQMLLSVVPPFLQDSNLPAPSDTDDLIRGAIKSTMALVGNKLLFNIYGQHAPVMQRKQDKLPVMWQALIDWMVAQLRAREVGIQASETDEEGVYRVFAFTALPLQSGDAAEAHAPQYAATSAEGTEQG